MARILYIEDNELLRDSTEVLLKQVYGHSVITRPDTDKADAIASIWRPDLVLTDHDLGRGKETGLELAKRLQADGVKVAVLSGSPEARGQGVPFFYKPGNMDALLKGMEVDV